MRERLFPKRSERYRLLAATSIVKSYQMLEQWEGARKLKKHPGTRVHATAELIEIAPLSHTSNLPA
jgi:hypothetical protein